MKSLRNLDKEERDDVELDESDVEVGTCALCNYAIYERDLASTALGPMHESCAEAYFPYDHGDSVWPK